MADKESNKLAVCRSPLWISGCVLIILIAARFWYHLVASPLPDEAYYWLWGQHPDLSYYDHPPLQAWLQMITSAFLEPSRFALRLPALLSNIIIIYVVMRFCALIDLPRTKRSIIALMAGIFASPLFFIFTQIAFNDYAMIAALSLAGLWAFEEALWLRNPTVRPRKGRILLIGFAIGLAGLSKFNALFFAVGLFAFILMDAPCRKMLRSPWLYLAAMVALMCLAPVFWWNLQNGAQSFEYNLNQRLTPAADFSLWAQRGLIFTFAFALSCGPIVWLGAFFTRAQNDKAQLLLRMAWVIFGVSTLGFLGLSYQTYVLYYWNIPAIIMLVPCLILTLRSPALLYGHMLFGVVLSLALTFNHTIFPISALSGQTDDESAIMHGWGQITPWIERQIHEKNPDFIAATDYRLGSILAFWTDRKDTEVIAHRISQFTLWFDPLKRDGQTALILASQWFPLEQIHRQHFVKLEQIDQIDISLYGYPITTYRLYLGTLYQGAK